ncbi:MAG TPA: hypothetical protein VGF16_10995 [Bryobacteraceae bacterium]|jgi:hypothetical protein
MRRLILACTLALLGSYARAESTVDATSFTATITDLRSSATGQTRFATATIRFQNKGASPIILAYVWDSGLATDDRGNRFGLVNEQSVRGIGVITGRNVDAKFVLQPNAGSDARFEFAWAPSSRNDLFGSQITDLEITVRELVSEGGNQYSLGAEHLLHYNNPKPGAATPVTGQTSAPTTTAIPATTSPAGSAPGVPAAVPAAAAPVDQCAGKQRCYDAGPFVAEVTSVTASQTAPGQNHIIKLNIRFRNTSAQNLVLGYKPLTSQATDNLGNPYTCCGTTTDISVTGMPIVAGAVNPSFVLKPGQSGNATFTLARFTPRTALGTSFTHDAVVMELEVINASQIRDGREYSMHFADLSVGALGVPVSVTDLNDATQKLKGIFSRKK